MLFTFRVTAETTHTKTEPATKELKLRAGYVTKVSVLIPAGHAALAHLALFHGETQIIPWGADQWLEGNDETILWEPDYELPSEPARLEARAWSEDDTYAHTFYIRIWVDPNPARLPVKLLVRILKLAEKFLRSVVGGA